MIFLAIFISFILITAICVGAHNRMCIFDEEIITETTTEEPSYSIVGNLQRQFENDQAFVIDPVDKKKIWLNSNDDMYEDANDKVWRLY